MTFPGRQEVNRVLSPGGTVEVIEHGMSAPRP